MSLYEQDFYAWTHEQAALLREGRFAELDVGNIAEELESMGRRDKREIRSRLIVVVTHLLKWHYQPEKRSASWQDTINEQQEQIHWLLEESPSLRPLLATLLAQAYPAAKRKAAVETALPRSTFPPQCPWTVEEALQALPEGVEEA